ncbi:hypothetical protein ACIA5C_09105 [Actinoplanes sp. NPDC051343]|uniref:hypothetical protein n=1 Tax=Actinoplanes sp. NPDC051343 TaxID=3363906 RepID=UPI0037920358
MPGVPTHELRHRLMTRLGFPADLVQPPRSWVARNHHLVHYSRMPRGGHYAAREQPDLLAGDIRAFARKLRADYPRSV